MKSLVPVPPSRQKKILALCAVFVSIALAAGLWGCKRREKPPLPEVGSPAPPFSIATFGGSVVTLESLKGKPVVVNFWASWCPPCRTEADSLQKAYEEFEGRVYFLGIAVRDRPENSIAFIEAHGLTFPNAPDETDEVRVLYNVASIPKTFVIDRYGTVSYVHMGPVTEEVLARELKKLL